MRASWSAVLVDGAAMETLLGSKRTGVLSVDGFGKADQNGS
jgi:hypothetical protein